MPKRPAPMKKKPKPTKAAMTDVRPNAVKNFLKKYSQGMR